MQLKKFDKNTRIPASKAYTAAKLQDVNFRASTRLDELIRETEDAFTSVFEHGDRKRALERLRQLGSTKTSVFVSLFPTQLILLVLLAVITSRPGAADFLLVLGFLCFSRASQKVRPPSLTFRFEVLISGRRFPPMDKSRNAILAVRAFHETWARKRMLTRLPSALLQVFGALFLPILFSLLFFLNLLSWHYSRINYVLVFQFDVSSSFSSLYAIVLLTEVPENRFGRDLTCVNFWTYDGDPIFLLSI